MSALKKQVREAFRTAVFERDGHRCVMCGRNDCKLDAHHITDRNDLPAGGYVKENGITLCDAGDDSCHFRAELYHRSGGTDSFPGFHPRDLYTKIGSSLAAAMAASNALQRRLGR